MTINNGDRCTLTWAGVHDGVAGSQRANETERQTYGADLAVAFTPNLAKAKPRAGAMVAYGESHYAVVQVGASQFSAGMVRALLKGVADADR